MVNITFIVPLAARQTVKDWTLTSLLCRLTVQSCLAQRHRDVAVELCCHDAPGWLVEEHDPRLAVHRAAFPPPPPDPSYAAGTSDKWKKVAMGLVAARSKGSVWLMIVDADDLVSRRLSGYLASNPDLNGVALKTGYRYPLGSEIMYFDDHFNCGTNAIIRADRVYLPKSLQPDEISKCLMLRAGHTLIEEAMAKQATPLSPLPFPGAIYVQHSGQHSRKRWPHPQRTISMQLRAWRRLVWLGAWRELRLARPLLHYEFGVGMADVRRVPIGWKQD